MIFSKRNRKVLPDTPVEFYLPTCLLVFTFYSPLPFPLSHLHNWGFINRLATAMTFPSYRFIVTLLHFRNWYWCMENKFTDNFAFILRRGRIIIPAAFKISPGIFFIFLSISPSIMINIYVSIQMSNWPDTNALIAPAFEFIRVYFTRETVVTKPTCICLSKGFALFDGSVHILVDGFWQVNQGSYFSYKLMQLLPVISQNIR